MRPDLNHREIWHDEHEAFMASAGSQSIRRRLSAIIWAIGFVGAGVLAWGAGI